MYYSRGICKISHLFGGVSSVRIDITYCDIDESASFLGERRLIKSHLEVKNCDLKFFIEVNTFNLDNLLIIIYEQ